MNYILEAKQDEGKPDYTLVPMTIVDAIERIREYGTKKYGDRENYKNVSPDRFWKAFLRHVRAAWDTPFSYDEESGYPHIWHAACNLAFFLELTENDIFKGGTNVQQSDQ